MFNEQTDKQNEQQFVSFDMPDDTNTNIKSGGLNFLPTNYDYDAKPFDNSKNSDSSSLNFENNGMVYIISFFF